MFRETESASVCHADKFFRKMIDSSGKRLPRYLDTYRDRWQVENNVSCCISASRLFTLFFLFFFFWQDCTVYLYPKKVLPVFSLISQRTLKSAGFILWQFSPCFLFQYKTRHDTEINSLISHRSTTEQDFLFFLRGWRLYKFYDCHASLKIRTCYFQQMEFKDTLR